MARVVKGVESPRNSGEQRQGSSPSREESTPRRDRSDAARQGRCDSEGARQTDRGVAGAVRSASAVVLGVGASSSGGSVFCGLVSERARHHFSS